MAPPTDHMRLSLRDALKYFNKRLLLTCCLLGMSPFNFGLDNMGFSVIQSMDYFDKQFGEWDPKKKTWVLPTWWLSIFNATPFITFFFGIIVGSEVSKRFGRRMCIFVMSLWALAAAAVIISSKNRDQILAGRILNYFYVGMELSVIPVYQSEITPGPVRGLTVGAYHTALVLGGFVINCVSAGTSNLKDNRSWMIPFALYFVMPACVAATIWFLPESPRWLVLNDRLEDAQKSLWSLRVGAKKYPEDAIEAEWQQMVRGIHAEQSSEKSNYLDIFRSANNTRRRTLTIMGINFFLQGTGQQLGTTYGAIYIKSLGIKPFYITVGKSVMNLVIGFLTQYLQDFFGRRKLLFVGGACQCLSLLAMGGLGTRKSDQSTNIGVVATIFTFIASYAIGWAAVSQTLNAELSSTHMRDFTFRTASATAVSTQILFTYVIPYLLNAPYANLGPKIGFIFAGIAFLGLFYTYFFIPDCRGRSLEEVDRLYRNNVPAWKFHKTDMSTLPQLPGETTKEAELEEPKVGSVVHEERKTGGSS